MLERERKMVSYSSSSSVSNVRPSSVPTGAGFWLDHISASSAYCLANSQLVTFFTSLEVMGFYKPCLLVLEQSDDNIFFKRTKFPTIADSLCWSINFIMLYSNTWHFWQISNLEHTLKTDVDNYSKITASH